MNDQTIQDLKELKRLIEASLMIAEAGLCHDMSDQEKDAFKVKYGNAYIVLGPYHIHRKTRSSVAHLITFYTR